MEKKEANSEIVLTVLIYSGSTFMGPKELNYNRTETEYFVIVYFVKGNFFVCAQMRLGLPNCAYLP